VAQLAVPPQLLLWGLQPWVCGGCSQFVVPGGRGQVRTVWKQDESLVPHWYSVAQLDAVPFWACTGRNPDDAGNVTICMSTSYPVILNSLMALLRSRDRCRAMLAQLTTTGRRTGSMGSRHFHVIGRSAELRYLQPLGDTFNDSTRPLQRQAIRSF
jgi:hypothetical protein